jgi:carbamoyl-phosphate synthase large subunit
MKDGLNIFIPSAGRRVELVQCFQKAARRLGFTSNVVAGDCSKTAPALYFADRAYELPRINDPGYIDAIIDICNKEDISLVIPTIDTELLLLAENKQYIEARSNAKVLISDVEIIRICRDKLNTQRFMESNGFGVPRLYTEEELQEGNVKYPVFIKPRSGSSSINAFRADTEIELNTYRSLIADPIIQEFVEGEEYTVDVFLDFNSTVITIVPRLRIATRSGEISKGRIVKDRQIIQDIMRLMNVLKPIGHITVQLMKTSNGIKYIEINPRFGGGAPMSIQSGADSCENLYRLLMGEKLEYNENYRDKLTFLRFDSSICLDENMEIV